MTDLTADLDRIERHIACLVKAMADEPAPAAVRAALDVELAVWRLARDLAAADLDTREEAHT